MGLVNSGPKGVPTPSPDEVYVVGGDNGYGSTNTTIRRYTTVVKQLGASITYKDDAILGGSFTINDDGLYAITMMDDTTVNKGFGVSLNQDTGAISNLTAKERLFWVFSQGGSFSQGPGSCVTYLNRGDIIRGMADTVSSDTAESTVNLRIAKIS